jgi:hypothetical protein
LPRGSEWETAYGHLLDQRKGDRYVASLTTEVVLFTSSFAPLLVIFALLNTFGSGWPSVACLIVAGASVVGLFGFLRLAQRLAVVRPTASSAQARDQDIVGYVVTYLLPFASLGASSWRERLAIVLFIALVGVLYLRAGLHYVNPLLALARYRLFEVELKTGRSVIVISPRRYIRPGEELPLRALSETIFIEARNA